MPPYQSIHFSSQDLSDSNYRKLQSFIKARRINIFFLSYMGCNQNLIFSHRLHYFTIYLLIFLISSSCLIIIPSEGRKLIKTTDPFQTVNDEDRAMLRAQIGSRPPRCDGRCSSCGHCEAIQVPTNPQIKNGSNISASLSTVAYARGDYNSNYKPMSWKCKCGNVIFNP
ncbi:hypothetical protein Leryth_006670 [Lithospermum erythrorhizon]|nr:hypothetical protein Leryth_006670 [Lithospermum erythrorhizon]